MNIRTPLACTLLLCACSESAKNEFKEEFTQSFRTEFVRSATEACVEKAAGKSPFDSATTEKSAAASEKNSRPNQTPEGSDLAFGRQRLHERRAEKTYQRHQHRLH